MSNEFDLIVIGGGTSGLPAARMAASLGLKTALLEPGFLAGTCLNYGCTPTKTLEYTSEVFDTVYKSERFGVKSKVKLDFKVVMGRVKRIVEEARKANEEVINSLENLTWFKSNGRFNDQKNILIENNGVEITAENIIIATGASPFVPPVKGLKDVDYLTYRTILDLKKLPESIAILGGGFIGVEYASIFSRFKIKVTILEIGDRILPAEDEDISLELAKYLSDSKVNIKTGINVSKVYKKGNTVVISTEDNQDIQCDEFMVATGIKPNTEGLGLEDAMVKTDDRGYIKVDDFLKTTNNRVYAIGDVNRKYLFTHAGLLQSENVIKNINGGNMIKMEYIMPHAVFSDPEIGSVGLLERDLIAKNVKYKKIISRYSDISRSLMIDDERGFLKLLVEDGGNKILGAHIIGPYASILIQEFVVLMNCENPKEAFRKTVHIHPTLFELMNEARDKWASS